MPIISCSEQKSKTLEEFYKEFIPKGNDTFVDVGSPMLNVLNLINDTFNETIIYGLTSHSTLLFLSENCSMSTWFVALNGLSINGQTNEYYIEYLMTSKKQPWTNAMIKGGTKSIDELRKYIIIAMKESEGWPDCKELNELYNNLNM